ncbi:hypothetical protein [Streptomyces sp. NPDC050428]|uniref:hypothetical protein n=1 Tax=Streptomyces sp. NPDC050428 TaxID=3155757 RepID=UPI0034256564
MDGCELRPAYDPGQGTFTIQLWASGRPAGIHGLREPFKSADECVRTLDAFLVRYGLRSTNGSEKAHLLGALLHCARTAG